MLRLLTVTFDAKIDPWQLRAFRGAIAAKVGHQHDLFHNHDAESGGFHYRMPLIQYKQERGQPMLVCLNEGIEELHHFFSQPDWTLNLNGRSTPIRIAQLEVKQCNLAVSTTIYRYHIRQWIGLNEENYSIYSRLTGMVERLALLEKVLQNQIVGLLHQLDQRPIDMLRVKLIDKKDEQWVSFKEVKVLAFSLEFEVNVALPDYIGLGKGCSAGWGVVKGLGKGKVK